MDGTGGQRVRYAQVDRSAFAPAQQRGWDRAIDRNRRTRAPSEVHRGFADSQVEIGTGKDIVIARPFQRPAVLGPQTQRRGRTAGGQPLNKLATRQRATIEAIHRHIELHLHTRTYGLEQRRSARTSPPDTHQDRRLWRQGAA